MDSSFIEKVGYKKCRNRSPPPPLQINADAPLQVVCATGRFFVSFLYLSRPTANNEHNAMEILELYLLYSNILCICYRLPFSLLKMCTDLLFVLRHSVSLSAALSLQFWWVV